MMRRLKPLKRGASDEAGVTVVEFGLLAPVFLTLLLGMFELGFQVYAQSIVQGAMQQAARSTALEGGASSAARVDQAVEDSIHNIVPGADIVFTRKNYFSFNDVGKAEIFTDGNGDGVCNNGEPFEDVVNIGTYDTDRGRDGVGGARDAVLYTVEVTYDRITPIANFIGMSSTVVLEGATVLRNQPYSEQGQRIATVGYCP
jgi:Flp pilus assembly protein TadG